MTELTNNTWRASPSDIAHRFEMPELSGFFQKSLTIEPGTRAVTIENGRYIGVIGPGRYTLETFCEKLAFWNRKQVTVVLLHDEPVTLEFPTLQVETSERLSVEVTLTPTLAIDDPVRFLPALLKDRDVLTRAELTEWFRPIVEQAVAESVGRLSLKDLTVVEGRRNLDAVIGQTLRPLLEPYGMRFERVQTVSIAQPQYDEQQRRVGQIWLSREGMALDAAAAQLAVDQMHAQIQQRETRGELEILDDEVELDHQTSKQAVLRRRIALRAQRRLTIQADNFDTLRTEEARKAFLRQLEAEGLVAEADHAELAATLRGKAADRTSQRDHLLKKIDLDQQYDLDELRAELAHQRELKSLARQLELVERGAGVAGAQSRVTLERQARESTARRKAEIDELEHRRATTRLEGELRREEGLAQSEHDAKVRGILGNADLSDAEKRRQIGLIDLELDNARRDAEEKRLRDGADWNARRHQEELRLEQELADREAARKERALQSEREHELKRGAQSTTHLQAHAVLTPEQLIAAVNPTNAAILADLEKTKVTAGSPPATPKPAPAVEHCPQCGTVILPSHRFCPRCGLGG